MASLVGSNVEQIELLAAVNDDHGGVIVELKTPIDPKAFAISLKLSISNWRQQGIKGVWIKLPIELASLVQIVVEEGFWYHHAEPNYLMLVYWIPATEHTIPVNATHRVGVGALVVNDRKEVSYWNSFACPSCSSFTLKFFFLILISYACSLERNYTHSTPHCFWSLILHLKETMILVVQEKSGKSRGLGLWKIPTGVINQGEEIFSGVIREVKEETGIDTEFVEVLAFRQSHQSFFEKSDLFFLCMLRPLSFVIQKQESEIDVAQWMPIKEYAADSLVQKHEFSKYILDLGIAKMERDYAGFSPVCMRSAFIDGQSHLYLNTRGLEQKSSLGNVSSNN